MTIMKAQKAKTVRQQVHENIENGEDECNFRNDICRDVIEDYVMTIQRKPRKQSWKADKVM